MSVKPIKLIVGLGNPGEKYDRTRHNAGFLFLDALCSEFNEKLQVSKNLFGRTTQVTIMGKQVRLLAPDTFMNLSGKSVQACMNFYKIDIEEVLVVHDELDHEPGSARLKFSGGHGGHNGLRDIVQKTASKDFLRLRLGVGHPGHAKAVASYVLKTAPKIEQDKIDDAIIASARVMPEVISGELPKAMNELHSST